MLQSEFNPLIMSYGKTYSDFANEHLFAQTMLVEEQLKKGFFQFDDIINLYDQDDEIQEIFEWLYAPNFNDQWFGAEI